MIVKFWGVRGSIPVSRKDTLRYGGHTSCLSFEREDRVLVIDAGTGIRPLGEAMRGDGREVFLMVSHLHWDHVSGFPFFVPLFEPGRVIHLLDYTFEGQPWSLLGLLDGIHFPIRPSDLPSAFVRVSDDVLGYLAGWGFTVREMEVNHPGGARGFRIEEGGRAFVYIPDNELEPPVAHTSRQAFIDFCRGADVLCHDAQYLGVDMPVKHGWGHSLVEQVCQLAVDAGVRHLVLHHHDPDRDDASLDALEEVARQRLEPHGISCTAAYEGLTFVLEDESGGSGMED